MMCLSRLVALLLTGLLLAGCVTETPVGSNAPRQHSPQEQVNALVAAANAYLTQTPEPNSQRAKELLRRALEIDPRSPDAHHLLAMAFWQTEEMDLAEDAFRKAIRHKSDFSQARMNYAAFLQRSGRFPEARSQLEQVLDDTLYTERANAFLNYGSVLRNLGDLPGAAEAFRRSLALDRTNPFTMLSLATVHFQLQDYAQAERHYRQFRLNGQQTPGSLLLGIRIAEQRGDADGKASYEMALRNLFPESAESRQYFGSGQGS